MFQQCAYWNGLEGSCPAGTLCRRLASHVPGFATAANVALRNLEDRRATRNGREPDGGFARQPSEKFMSREMKRLAIRYAAAKAQGGAALAALAPAAPLGKQAAAQAPGFASDRQAPGNHPRYDALNRGREDASHPDTRPSQQQLPPPPLQLPLPPPPSLMPLPPPPSSPHEPRSGFEAQRQQVAADPVLPQGFAPAGPSAPANGSWTAAAGDVAMEGGAIPAGAPSLQPLHEPAALQSPAQPPHQRLPAAPPVAPASGQNGHALTAQEAAQPELPSSAPAPKSEIATLVDAIQELKEAVNAAMATAGSAGNGGGAAGQVAAAFSSSGLMPLLQNGSALPTQPQLLQQQLNAAAELLQQQQQQIRDTAAMLGGGGAKLPPPGQPQQLAGPQVSLNGGQGRVPQSPEQLNAAAAAMFGAQANPQQLFLQPQQPAGPQVNFPGGQGHVPQSTEQLNAAAAMFVAQAHARQLFLQPQQPPESQAAAGPVGTAAPAAATSSQPLAQLMQAGGGLPGSMGYGGAFGGMNPAGWMQMGQQGGWGAMPLLPPYGHAYMSPKYLQAALMQNSLLQMQHQQAQVQQQLQHSQQTRQGDTASQQTQPQSDPPPGGHE